MPTLPIVLSVIAYRVIVIVLGAGTALFGMWLLKGSRTKAGLVEATWDKAKLTLKNVAPGVCCCVLGGVAILAGFCKIPTVTIEEGENKGNGEQEGRKYRRISLEGLPPIKQEEAENVELAVLLQNPERYEGKLVKVKGKVVR